jgi:peptidoglycan/LPS O-acetylase OafA/YrhL
MIELATVAWAVWLVLGVGLAAALSVLAYPLFEDWRDRRRRSRRGGMLP